MHQMQTNDISNQESETQHHQPLRCRRAEKESPRQRRSSTRQQVKH